MLAARKIEDEWNIFEGVFTNPMFIGVWLIIVGGQVVIIEGGLGAAMSVHEEGLTPIQWGICVGVSCTCLCWNFLLKQMPHDWCYKLGDENEEDEKVAA